MTSTTAVPIAIRAYTEGLNWKPPGQAAKLDVPSNRTLIFDCETTIDAAQRLRFGVYQVRKGDRLTESGIFYDPDGPESANADLLQVYAHEHGLKLRTLADFIANVFYRVGYDWGGSIVSFNLPFDLSRIALNHSPARGSMRGGFTFKLSRWKSRAQVRVKRLSRRAALIDFATPSNQNTAPSSRKRGINTPRFRGHFIDVATLAAAQFSQGFTLASLCARLGVPTQKQTDTEHGAPLTEAYISYACTDVQATWECYAALRLTYLKHRLATPAHRILSEASIGKAYLKGMGAEPLLQRQPDMPRALFGKLMGAYSGGRAEVHWRRTIKRILYCDFKSMYPTVNALMGLWRFTAGEGLAWRDGTDEARSVLERATLGAFQRPDAWKELVLIVRVRPDRDLFPVRAPYGGEMHTIGLNYLTCPSDVWVTLADCVSAKVMSGKAPVILEAIKFEPGPLQPNLQPIELFGDPAYRIDPISEDFFVRAIDLRDDAKAKGDPIEQAIKIIANATSYGIFIEVLRDDTSEPETLSVYGPSGARRFKKTTATEQPGRYFNPLLGVLITGAARLMLGLAERQVMDAGLDWAFCDTDSIAMVKPDGVSEEEFAAKASSIIDWFLPLNPYRKPGSILKSEDINSAISSVAPQPLFCFAISAKRYVLFNLDGRGRPIIRKASAHGLGHYMAPYGEKDAPKDIPAPAVPLGDIGVERWQYDLWYKIIESALAGHPDSIRLDYHPALKQPAMTRFGVSSPHLERWLATWNAERDYQDRVRPFGFMVTFQWRGGPSIEMASDEYPKRGRPKKRAVKHPIAPFDRNPAQAVLLAFDRATGDPVAASEFKSYGEALMQFHLHPEDKFLNGDFLDRGRTERRHVVASSVRLIGKEANKWEEQWETGEAEAMLDFGEVSAGQRR